MPDPVDLPPNIASEFQQTRMATHQSNMAMMTQLREQNAANAEFTANAMRLSAFRRFDELGIGESRAQTGMLATDVGGPTNSAGTANS